jgi:hypothetical protein
MSNVDQFKAAVIAAGAEAKRIERGPGGAERLVIATLGGLVTKQIPLQGEPDKDIDTVTFAAKQIVASAKRLTAEPATTLCRTVRQAALPPTARGRA